MVSFDGPRDMLAKNLSLSVSSFPIPKGSSMMIRINVYFAKVPTLEPC